MTPEIAEVIRRKTSGGISFFPVMSIGFYGGFFLNDRLPYRPDDIYFSGREGDITVLCSGNIYNRTELQALSGSAKNSGVAELIADLFTHHGPDFVKSLNGDFSIFITRPASGISYIFRDHVGISPLAWTDTGDHIYFSSDIIELCRALAGRQPVYKEYLLAYFKYTDYRNTPDMRVSKLLPGHYLKISDGETKLVKYWDPGAVCTDRKLGYETMLSELGDLVRDAVKIRCDSRFVAGAHVTGGLDSSVVASLVRDEYRNQSTFQGFSWSPEGSAGENFKYDERDIIREFCNLKMITPNFTTFSINNFIRAVSAYYNNQGYFSEERASDLAVEKGVNLVFSGWGGDEFISTGDRGIETDLLRGFRLRAFFKRNPVRHPRKFFKYLFRYVVYPALGILDRDTAAAFRDEARYVKGKYKASDRKALRNFYSHLSRRQMHLRVLQFYHLQERCESWAVNGFRKGIEYRYPLLDRRLIEYMLKVPSELLCRSTEFRPLLRIICADILPAEVLRQFDKSDPVCWGSMEMLYEQASASFAREVDDWNSNNELGFIDFGLLKKDIAKLRQKSPDLNRKALFRALVYIKGIHEFTRSYRET